jgi:hypothetical protein
MVTPEKLGENLFFCQVKIFTLEFLTFCLYRNNQRSYGRMDAASVFSASNWSKTYPPCCSDSS